MMGYPGGFGMMGGAGWGFGFGFVLMTLFWIFVVAGIVWLVLVVTRAQGGGERGSTALSILAERLARGEIDAAEFRIRRAAIEESAK